MPVHYRILREPRVIVTSYQGVVSGDTYVDAYKAIFNDPDYRPGMDELCDTRPMHAFDIQLAAIRDVAILAADHVGPDAPMMRTAVLQGSEANSIVSKLYSAVADMYEKEELSLFSSLADAVAWLGLDQAAGPTIKQVLAELGKT